MDSTPPIIQVTSRTVHLDIVLDHNEYQVAMELDADYINIFEVHWDTDPILLKAKRLVGAMFHSKTNLRHVVFVLVLATNGGDFERVGVLKSPLQQCRIADGPVGRSGMRRHDLSHLTRDAKLEAFKRFGAVKYKSWYDLWLSVFGDPRSILIQ